MPTARKNAGKRERGLKSSRHVLPLAPEDIPAVRFPSLLDPFVARQGEVLSQINLCNQILSQPKLAPSLVGALESWRTILEAFLQDALLQFLGCDNVNTSADAKERVKAFMTLLCEVVGDKDMDGSKPANEQERIKDFLLQVAWHEGDKLKTRRQYGDGPARSFFQIEAHRAKECIEYAKRKGWLGKLATACGKTEAEIEAAAEALPSYDSNNPNASAKYPEGNLIEECLRMSDRFGIYLARICFKKVHAPIPAGDDAQAAYWYDNWKRAGGDKKALISQVVAGCEEVHKLK